MFGFKSLFMVPHIMKKTVCLVNLRKFCNHVNISKNYKQLSHTVFNVNPGYGKLKLYANCNCIVKPANLQDYPDSDHASVTIWHCEEDSDPNIEVVCNGTDNDTVRVDALNAHPNSICEINLPIKYDIHAEVENDSDVRIDNMEAEQIAVWLKSGNIGTKNVKCGTISITIDNGSIKLDKLLQGNIFITAKSTNLKAGRLQGLEMNIQAETLNSEIESSYINKSIIVANKANLKLKNLHGSTDLKLLAGNVDISNLHGAMNMTMENGTADIHVSNVEENSLIAMEKGNLTLSLMDIKRQSLEVTASSIVVADDLKTQCTLTQKENESCLSTGQEEGKPMLKVCLKDGQVDVKKKDWFSSLGLAKK